MPLPAYLLETPDPTTMATLLQQWRKLGCAEAPIRTGRTIELGNLNPSSPDHLETMLRPLVIAADRESLSIEARLAPSRGGLLPVMQRTGFRLILDVVEHAGYGPHLLVRRSPRRIEVSRTNLVKR